VSQTAARAAHAAAAIELTARSPAATVAIGQAIASCLGAGDVVCLEGPLGAGKTMLTRGLAAGLGADPAAVHSPTYALLYELGGERAPLVHADLYRLERAEDVLATGLTDILDAADCVVAIEWWRHAAPWLPVERVEVRLRPNPEGARRVVQIACGDEPLRAALRAACAALVQDRDDLHAADRRG
jgi:tRNA threonylcarbamoyladenosine biosynthesis protein TsaE